MGTLVYSGLTSESSREILKELRVLHVDSIKSISIKPVNAEWKVNLTLNTIKVTEKERLEEIVNVLNEISEKFPDRGLREGWEARMILHYKTGKTRSFDIVDSKQGVVLFLRGTMGRPKYKMDGLKRIFEELANYTEPVGRK